MSKNLFFSLLLFIGTLAVSCKKDSVLENQVVSGNMTLAQKSFTPTAFDNGKPIKAKIVQDFSGTLSQIGKITATLNVDFDLVTNKSADVLATYSDASGDKIYTTSSSVATATGLNITEKITGGTGKFAKITGGGTYFVNLDFVTGNGSGVLSWTVTY